MSLNLFRLGENVIFVVVEKRLSKEKDPTIGNGSQFLYKTNRSKRKTDGRGILIHLLRDQSLR